VEQAQGNIANCDYGSSVKIDVELPLDALEDFKKQMAPIAFSVSEESE
jgi:hypothetical protein